VASQNKIGSCNKNRGFADSIYISADYAIIRRYSWLNTDRITSTSMAYILSQSIVFFFCDTYHLLISSIFIIIMYYLELTSKPFKLIISTEVVLNIYILADYATENLVIRTTETPDDGKICRNIYIEYNSCILLCDTT
jgi:hypothetical protein